MRGIFQGNGRLVLAGVALAVMSVLALFLFFPRLSSELTGTARTSPADIVTFKNIPQGAVVEASLEMNGAASQVAFQDGKLVLSQEQQDAFRLPYVLRATMRLPSEQYYDFTWTIDSRGVEYSIGADGFAPQDQATLLMDWQMVQTVPFDWSGRIEFPIILIVAKKDTNACIEISGGDTPLRACHVIHGKKDA